MDATHGLSIQGYDVDLYLDVGETKTAEFIAEEVGTFAMYCSIPCGVGHSSMTGTFIVEE